MHRQKLPTTGKRFNVRTGSNSIEVVIRVPGSGQRPSILGNQSSVTPTPSLLRYHKKKIGAVMFVVIWQFEIAEENITGFEAAYSPEGAWAQLFRTSSDYLGTELLRDAYVSGSYLTIDRWASEEAFRAFRKDHDREYEALDRACDALTSRETRIGAYTA